MAKQKQNRSTEEYCRKNYYWNGCLWFCGKWWKISVSLTSFMAYQWGNFAGQLFVSDIPRITCWSHSSVFTIWRRWRLEIQVDHPTHLLKAFGVLCGFKSICLLWQVVAPNISVHYPCMPTWFKWQIPCKIVCFNAHAKQHRHWKLYFLQGLFRNFLTEKLNIFCDGNSDVIFWMSSGDFQSLPSVWYSPLRPEVGSVSQKRAPLFNRSQGYIHKKTACTV